MTAERGTILIVDDEELARQVIQRKLSGEGHRCIEASNADQALDQLKRNPIELVILDIKMPGKSGIELLPEVRERYPDTEVIMATAVNDMDTVLQCIRQGAFDYITKPLNFEELILTVNKALEMRRLKLIESGDEFRTIFESANDILLSIDKGGKILDVNNKLTEIGGYEREELLGKNVRSLTRLMTRRSLAIVVKNFAKRIAGINVPPYEVEMLTRDGNLLRIEINAVAIRRGGKIVGDLAILRDVTERRQAEKALKESEERLRTILDSASDGILVADVEERRFYIANKAICHMLGYSLEEIKNLNVTDIHPEKDLPYVLKQFEKQSRGEITLSGDMPVKRKDGSVFYADVNTSVLTLGGKSYLTGVFRDTTERKQLEQELQESKDSLLEAQQIAHIGSWDWDISKDKIYYSDEFHRIFGQQVKNFAMFLSSLNPDDREYVEKSVNEALRGDKPYDIEYRIILPNREERVIHAQGRVTTDRAGKPNRMVGTVQDVTERRQTEKVLQESEERYRVVIQGAHDMIQSIRPDGSFIFVNPAWLQTLGYTEEELPGLNMFNIIHPESMAHCQDMFTKVMAGESVYNVSATFIAKDGRKILVEGNAAPRYLGDSIVTTQGIFRDVTERKQAEAEIKRLYEQVKAFNIQLEEKIKERTVELEIAVREAEAANKAKSEFLSSMSHELRTPLTAIIGFSQVLGEQYFGELNEKQAEYVKDILESGEHLLSLINDVLDLAKIEAGKAELELSTFNVKELLENSIIMIKEKALKHSLALETQISSKLDALSIIADERKLKQVVFNLLSNAAKFTPDHGSITVGGIRNGSELIISVSDTGIGIGSEEQEKIFDEFYQVLSGPKDKTPGTGLGLPLSKRLVEMHGGRIWVESKGKDKGSIFTFSIPIREPNQEAKP